MLSRKIFSWVVSSADDDALSDVPVADDKATKLSKEQVNELVKKIAAVMNDVQKISQPDFSLNLLAREVGSIRLTCRG